MSKLHTTKVPSKLDGKTFPTFVTFRLDENYKPVERVEIDVRNDFAVRKMSLQTELREVAGLQAWYGMLKEQAHSMMKRKRYAWHKEHERYADKVRTEFPKANVGDVKNKVNLQPKVRKAIERYMLWRDRHRMLHMLHEAMRDRHQTLRTIEASERKERELS